MMKFYEKSLQKIKELSEIPKEKEWNIIAKYEGYLTIETLRYISGIGFPELCKKIRAS